MGGKGQTEETAFNLILREKDLGSKYSRQREQHVPHRQGQKKLKILRVKRKTGVTLDPSLA